MANPRLCSIPNCGKPTLARGWCSRHYLKWYRRGDPSGVGTEHGVPHKFLNEVVIPSRQESCLPWPYAKHSSGYGAIYIDGSLKTVPRLVCEAIHGQPSHPKLEAAHSCGNGHLGCCNPNHLSWKTRSSNQDDRIAHGTSNRGERCGSAKLTRDQVVAIRTSLSAPKDLAAEFGVSDGTISDIRRRKSWSWL